MVTIPPAILSVGRIVRQVIDQLILRTLSRVLFLVWSLFVGRDFINRTTVEMTAGSSTRNLSPSSCEPVFETVDTEGK